MLLYESPSIMHVRFRSEWWKVESKGSDYYGEWLEVILLDKIEPRGLGSSSLGSVDSNDILWTVKM